MAFKLYENRKKFIISFGVISIVGIISMNLFIKNLDSKKSLHMNLFANKTFKPILEALKCEQKHNIVFIKTHKCSSSSIQNIFFRFGDINNLTFVVPNVDNYLGHPKRFNRNMVPPLNYIKSKFGKFYNIFTHHTRFNYNEIKSIMPSDSIYITIIRDPIYLFDSLYNYYDLKSNYKGLSLEKLVNNMYTKALNTSKINYNKRLLGKFGRNQMSYDLGLDSFYFDDVVIINKFIKKLDSNFDLVMIAERLEESLILLRHLLCWPIHNLIAFKHNVRYRPMNESHSQLLLNFNQDFRSKIRELNRADQILYTYFSHQFESRVKAFGINRMKTEIEVLNYETDKLYDKCVEKEVFLSELLSNRTYKPKSQVLALKMRNISDPICLSLTTLELSYTDYLRKKQIYLFPPKWLTPKPTKKRFIRRYRKRPIKT